MIKWLSKTKCREKAKLYYMDTDCFIIYIKTDDIYKDIAEFLLLHKKTEFIKNNKLILKTANI